jgi:hypothetical protein
VLVVPQSGCARSLTQSFGLPDCHIGAWAFGVQQAFSCQNAKFLDLHAFMPAQVSSTPGRSTARLTQRIGMAGRLRRTSSSSWTTGDAVIHLLLWSACKTPVDYTRHDKCWIRLLHQHYHQKLLKSSVGRQPATPFAVHQHSNMH